MTRYETTDLYLAACLKAVLDLPMPAIRNEGRHSRFVFDVNPDEAEKVASDFYGDCLNVPARRFGQELRDLKGLISQLRQPKRD